MILDSVGKCDVDVRRDLYSGIILTGTKPISRVISALGTISGRLYARWISADLVCRVLQEACSCVLLTHSSTTSRLLYATNTTASPDMTRLNMTSKHELKPVGCIAGRWHFSIS